MRYHLNGHFVVEIRKGFPVHHQLEKSFETAQELDDALNLFTSEYDSRNSYGLAIGISEEPSFVTE